MRKKGRTSTLMRKTKKKRRRRKTKKRQENPTGEEKREREKTMKMMMTMTDKNSHSKRGATHSRLEVLFMYRVVNGVQEVLIMSVYKCPFIRPLTRRGPWLAGGMFHGSLEL